MVLFQDDRPEAHADCIILLLLFEMSQADLSLLGPRQVYELDTLVVTHASRYPGPVLSLALSPGCGMLAVGLADGLLALHKHAVPKAPDGAAGQGGQPIQHGQGAGCN